MTREMGKVLKETRGDVQEAIDTAFYMAGEGRRLFGQTTPSELPEKFAMSLRMPVGVCGMIAPWNFPMAIPSWKLFPALVCGNTCVFKPAEDTPLSTLNLVEALLEAGLPEGVVNVVTGFGPDAGAPLAAHPDVQAVSFTGSSEVGRIIGQTAAANFKPCSLEMGGKNAMIVLEDANLELALDGAVWGAFGTTGPALHRDQPHYPSPGLSPKSLPGGWSSAPRRFGSATVWTNRSRWDPRSTSSSSRPQSDIRKSPSKKEPAC